MTKSELAIKLSEKAGLSMAHAERVVDAIFESMIQAFKNDDSIYLRGFGSFMMRKYEPYLGRNPKTGERVPVGNRRLPLFIVSEEMRQRVANHGKGPVKGPVIVHSGPGQERTSTDRTGEWSREDTGCAQPPAQSAQVFAKSKV